MPNAPLAQPKPRRSVPLWAVLVTVLVVAVVSAGVGGVSGGLVRSASSAAPADSGPKLNEELPSGAPSRAPDTIAGVAQRVSPSVVFIQGTGAQTSGNGSGFVIHDNYVVTNNHVASALERGGIEVVYSDGHTTEASVVGAAASSDIAVLELEDPNQVEPLEFGDSGSATVGDSVIAIGAPLGLAGTVTTGIISAVERPVTVGERGEETYINALQTDAAINPGNSGGPLVDVQGQVIGVNSAIATMGSGMEGGQSGSIGLGFAIPSGQAERVVNQILDEGEVQRPVIGVILDMRYQDEGALISSDEDAGGEAIVSDGPADKAGLESGDVIVEFDGTAVRDPNQLLSLIQQKAPGDKVEIGYVRDGAEKTATLTIGSSST